MFCLSLFGSCVDKHFQLVELVHADDAAGVFSAGSGFAAVAGGPAGITQWAVGEVNDFVGVVAGERDLTGAGQIQIICGEVIDLV